MEEETKIESEVVETPEEVVEATEVAEEVVPEEAS